METIDTATLAQWQDEAQDFVLIDTLPHSAFKAGHLPGAINIVSDEILDRAPAVLANRAATAVVYCASPACQRARLSTERLTSLGYRHVYHYVGGKQDWVASGRALEES